MKTLVTGGMGLVGGDLARRMAERGESVRVLIRQSSITVAITGLDVEIACGDVRDRAFERFQRRGMV